MSRTEHSNLRRTGAGKSILLIILLVLGGAAIWVAMQQRGADESCMAAEQLLTELLAGDVGFTDEEVHQKLGLMPAATRVPAKHRYVEEYVFRGPLRTQTIYAYYTTAATKFFEAFSVGTTLEDWERPDD